MSIFGFEVRQRLAVEPYIRRHISRYGDVFEKVPSDIRRFASLRQEVE